MPAAQGNQKYYLRVPDLEYIQGGPIKIGNIITNMFHPENTIGFLDPLPNVMKGAGAGEGDVKREAHGSINISFSAKLYEAFGGRAEASKERSLRTVYEYNEVESWYLSQNPTGADVKALRKKDEQVDGALNTGPVFIVTGLKIAKGLKYSNRRTAEMHGGLSGGGHINEHAAVEGRAEATRGGENAESYKILGDCILAYRLHEVKEAGRR
ncbi:uncharacterized protein BDZ99DRAFT_467152 [Mytilinidion resinicola]|uniref:Uncharacterized protein n=1 Tax=Mytilinidion resinicola TaxID=574789 RepID=A0A6A6YA99_9PEZI|nr:uncharacterized protein BDZ99DRAFT_467152 [Mytilinidion resinicola]KAF2804924.1 hypothetical protein BDZ99DRAFT_467152 [Mytilinidion resinicola]